MEFITDAHLPKERIFQQVEDFLSGRAIRIITKDDQRPWGGFLVIDEADILPFAMLFFNTVDQSELKLEGKVSPKILIVHPQKRLSWQYHHRRSEIWRLVAGTAGVVRSFDDQHTDVKPLHVGQFIVLQQGERHRLVGLEQWGIVSEIWQHVSPEHHSDEDDIVRLQDDFGR